MSHSTKHVFKNGAFVAGALISTLALVTVIRAVMRVDPYADLKKTSKSLDSNISVRLKDVQLRSYEGNKKVTQAHIDQVDVHQDGQRFDLYGVKDGKFYSDKGQLNFEAPAGTWNIPTHQMDAPLGGHVMDKNLDLKVPAFAYNSTNAMLHVPGELRGKFHGGDLSAKALDYNLNSGSTRARDVVWAGKVPATLPQDDDKKPRIWHIDNGDHGGTMSRDGDVEIFTPAVATDGDIYVFGDRVEHNTKTDVVTVIGNVKYISVKTNMTCDKAVIERGPKIATLTGHVEMLLKAKDKQVEIQRDEEMPPYRPIVPEEILKSRPAAPPGSGQTEQQKKLDDEIRSGKNMHDYPTICYAEKVIYWYKKGERRADISGRPQARQEFSEGRWRQLLTNTAHYDGEKETLKLQSSPGKRDTHMTNSIGDSYIADSMTVSTKDDDEKHMSGENFSVDYIDKTDEIPRGDKPIKQAGKNDKKGAGDKGTGGTTSTGTGTGTGGGTGGSDVTHGDHS